MDKCETINQPASYDIHQYVMPVFEVADLTDILTREHQDGLYHCKQPEKLDVYLERFQENQDASTILVCFNAAVGERKKHCAPFFSGRGLNRSLKLPLVAIADPLVSSTDLSLAWYAGGDSSRNLQKDLAIFLDQMARSYDAKLLIVGASGGGFAALALATLLKTEAVLVVSNPQTSISQYIYPFARDYVLQAFPQYSERISKSKQQTGQQKAQVLYDILDECNIVHDVTKVELPSNVNILYLQNMTDSHVKTHAAPFIKNRLWTTEGQNSIVSGNVSIYFGNWGKGHVGPSASIFGHLLQFLAEGKPVKEILNALELGLNGLNRNTSALTFLNRSDFRLVSSVKIVAGVLRANCYLKKNGHLYNDRKLNYAFYLMDGGERVASRFYAKSNSCTFSLPAKYKNLYIRSFARDDFNQIIAADSNRLVYPA